MASASGRRMIAQKKKLAISATTTPRNRCRRSTERLGQRWRVASIRTSPSRLPVIARQSSAL